MRLWVGLALSLGLAGCAEEPPPPPPVAIAPPPVDPECKTVTVFSSTKITKPSAKLPAEWKPFIGVWGKGAWDKGTWCHDLYVLKIEDSGKVTLIDAHGPGGRHDGSAFKRVGQLDKDNRLRFVADGIPREYWIDAEGKLRGVKLISENVRSEIVMNRKS